jgi:positive regulator of sigma E activity
MDVPCSEGDVVRVQMPDERINPAAFLIYIIPLLFLFLGFFLGGLIKNTDAIKTVFGIVCMALSFIIIVFLDIKMRKDRRFNPIITEIIVKSDVINMQNIKEKTK